MKGLNKKWYVVPCFVGKECWCRMIAITRTPMAEDESDIIVGSGCIDKNLAEYIVKTHNHYLKLIGVNRE